jgi:integrase-like protein
VVPWTESDAMDQRLQFVTDALSDRFTIHPGAPQENGAHERMHRTLKRRAVKPVQRTCAAQQRQVDAFRLEYNMERPHDALGGDTPGSRYVPSRRPFPERLPTPEYPGHFLGKRVTDAGTFRFQQRLLYIANALVNQHIGLEETDDGAWAIYFNTCLPRLMSATSSSAGNPERVTHVLGHFCYLSLRLLGEVEAA